MKAYLIPAVLFIMVSVASCNKVQSSPYGDDQGTGPARKVRYELYTNEDFSGDKDSIRFSLVIKNAWGTLFDSALAGMRVEEIPDSLHRIIIEKWVPGNDASTLTVGFDYTIKNVGMSWFLDAFPAGDTVKLLRYPFK